MSKREEKEGRPSNRMYTPEYADVRFFRSAPGAYGLAYHAGNVGQVEKKLAQKIVEAGDGEFVKQ